jgi:hypothetical protein
MREPKNTQVTFKMLEAALWQLVADARRLDDNALELLLYKLLQAREEVNAELRKRKSKTE